MGRTIYAEDCLLQYLTSLVKFEGYTIGLILGQSTVQKDFVIHLARTPPPVAKDIVEESFINSTRNIYHDDNTNKYIKSISDIPESWVADHAKHVTRMLPGGTWALGIFVVGSGDAFAENAHVQKFKSVLSAIRKNLVANEYLYGNNGYENLILNFNSTTKKYICKSVDIGNDGILKPAEWKFQKKATKWHKLETVVDLDRLFLILANEEKPQSLRQQLQDVLKSMSETINSALVITEGEVRSTDDTLEAIAKKRKDIKDCKNDDSKESEKPFQVSLYIPCKTDDNSSDVKRNHCSASMRLLGQLVSRTVVHQKASVEEAIVAVKQDIMRSLASRLEMHWDSLIEEENGSPEENVTLHEPPRRVLVELPQSKVTLSDYLFPGEGAQEALISLQELLDLRVQECHVEKDLELQVDTSKFYCQSDINVLPADRFKDVIEENKITTYIALFGIAFVVLVIAIVIHQLY